MSKNAVRNYITHTTHTTHTTDEIPWGLEQFASIWHFLALLYLLVLWLLLVQSISIEGYGSKNAFILSFFVLPIWMIADKIAGWLVLYAMSTLKIYDENACPDGSDPAQVELHVKGKKLYLSSRFAARILVVVILGIWIAGLWNITIPFISKLGSVATDALIIMTLAMFFWRFVSSWIESKINETGHETEKNNQGNDNEWGAVARGRSYTLLPMIRKFIASVLVIMVTMTILSSLGVDIGPLLAGAGVVGLAVGFGAQKLVADMFSGFFYLLDDAFRVGEYLQAGSVSGTVESITLRNIMLRHHRGMLQIVPHSELGPITNFMRGGIIVKFNLDFNYDADIEKIRKIIKKVGIAMLEDEEIGGDFIQPVKSQGVREISNSVMTIRVKFTAKPGTHFVIRREAYRRITESLQKNGIEYAKKQVIVDVPGLSRRNGEPELTPDEVEKIVDAAGGAARILEEQEAEKFPGKKELS
jgi:small-conductance mechanosensitive channel